MSRRSVFPKRSALGASCPPAWVQWKESRLQVELQGLDGLVLLLLLWALHAAHAAHNQTCSIASLQDLQTEIAVMATDQLQLWLMRARQMPLALCDSVHCEIHKGTAPRSCHSGADGAEPL